MYDDILGPIVEEVEEVEINIKPKLKRSKKGDDTLKAKKGTTLKANLAPPQSAPTVAKNVIDDKEAEEAVCPECGCEWEECECEVLDELDLDELEEILEDDPDGKDLWKDIGECGGCDDGKCDDG